MILFDTLGASVFGCPILQESFRLLGRMSSDTFSHPSWLSSGDALNDAIPEETLKGSFLHPRERARRLFAPPVLGPVNSYIYLLLVVHPAYINGQTPGGKHP